MLTNLSLTTAYSFDEANGLCDSVAYIYPSITRYHVRFFSNEDFNNNPFETEVAIKSVLTEAPSQIMFVYIETDSPGFLHGVEEANRQAVYGLLGDLGKTVYLATN